VAEAVRDLGGGNTPVSRSVIAKRMQYAENGPSFFDFYASDEKAMADIRACAAKDPIPEKEVANDVDQQIEALQKSATWEFHMAAAKSSQSNLDEAREHAHKAYNALDLIATLQLPPAMPVIQPITTPLALLSHESKALIAALPECDHAYPLEAH
jgi:hypothetical protein